MPSKTKFSKGDLIIEPGKVQILEIIEIDPIKNVYIFKTEWIHSLSKFKSFDISVVDSKFSKLY